MLLRLQILTYPPLLVARGRDDGGALGRTAFGSRSAAGVAGGDVYVRAGRWGRHLGEWRGAPGCGGTGRGEDGRGVRAEGRGGGI